MAEWQTRKIKDLVINMIMEVRVFSPASSLFILGLDVKRFVPCGRAAFLLSRVFPGKAKDMLGSAPTFQFIFHLPGDEI